MPSSCPTYNDFGCYEHLPDGVFTLAWSGTGTGTGTGTGKNGLYGFNKNLSHCTWTGTGKNTWNIFRTWRMGLVPIFQVLKMFPVMNTSVLPCPCSGAVWKVLIKTIQPILPGPCAMWKVLHNTGPSPCPGPGSGPSQCEYTITVTRIVLLSEKNTSCWHLLKRRFEYTEQRVLVPSRIKCVYGLFSESYDFSFELQLLIGVLLNFEYTEGPLNS